MKWLLILVVFVNPIITAWLYYSFINIMKKVREGEDVTSQAVLGSITVAWLVFSLLFLLTSGLWLD